MTGNRRDAFTLIELLIVVAIIAILAAIAVPNLLNAQVRAKVARVKNDLRTLATAIEAYSVDNNRPPYDGEPGFVHYGWASAQHGLTTPVSYLTTVPGDVFLDSTFPESTRPDQTNFIDYPSRKTHSYDYATAYWEDIATDAAKRADWQRNFGPSLWKITSCGPDRRFMNAGSFYGFRELYDPTNGTLSEGDVVRSQKVVP